MAKFFSADIFHFFSDTVSGILCLSLYVLIGFGLVESQFCEQQRWHHEPADDRRIQKWSGRVF
jgi:hypothetical protein